MMVVMMMMMMMITILINIDTLYSGSMIYSSSIRATRDVLDMESRKWRKNHVASEIDMESAKCEEQPANTKSRQHGAQGFGLRDRAKSSVIFFWFCSHQHVLFFGDKIMEFCNDVGSAGNPGSQCILHTCPNNFKNIWEILQIWMDKAMGWLVAWKEAPSLAS